MKNRFDYPVYLTSQDEGGFLVTFPDFPEAITQGESIDDALSEAKDCLEEAIANRIRTKADIPQSKISPLKREKYSVGLDSTFAAKTALYIKVRELKIKKTTLAKLLECDEKEVRRLLDPHFPSKFDRLEKALIKLGSKINMEIII